MDKAAVSVVLPVFNGEKYLSASLDSVLSQDYKDFELIVWDDGSTDNTVKMLASYDDARIRLFNSASNLGLFRTLNLAIDKAYGEYIRLWSYDDMMKPHCLETEINFHMQHPEIGMSYCACDVIDGSGRVIMPAPLDNTPEIISSYLAAQIMFYHGSLPGNIATVMIRKSVLVDVGRFRQDMQQSADFEMWERISAKFPIGFVRQPLIYLRQHANQFSRWKGMGTIFIKEDREVIRELTKRLPFEIQAYAKVYNRWHRHIQYVQYMLRCLLCADVKTAAKVYREIRKVDSVILLLWLWFISAGGRWFKKEPKFKE